MDQLKNARWFSKMIQPLKRRVMLMISRSVVRLVNDGGGLQVLQLTGYEGEILEKVERFQEYGFTSVPKNGAEAVLVAVGGSREHGLVVAIDDRRYRLKGLAAGEVALYDDQGQKVHLKRDGIYAETDGKIEAIAGSTARIVAPGGTTLETPFLKVTGDIIDQSSGDGISMAQMRSIYNAHVHPENDNGGPTDGPSEAM